MLSPDDIPGIRVSFIDVGQGDAVLIQSGEFTMLADCGSEDSAGDVVHSLKKQHIRRLDCILFTHPHDDHMGAGARILRNFEVGEVFVSPVPAELLPEDAFYSDAMQAAERNGVPVSEVSDGMTLEAGNAQVTMMIPEDFGDSLNDCSVCVLITCGEVSFLLTGDAEKAEEQSLVSGGELSHVSVYKAGHHGSKTSSCEELLSTITPDIAVISCGSGNSFAHPSDKTVQRLLEYTGNVFRTDLCGTITIESDGSSLQVRTERKGL